jgi:hypothetical protein
MYVIHDKEVNKKTNNFDHKMITKSSSSSVLLPFCFVSSNNLFSSSSWAHLCFAKAGSALTDFSSRSRSFALAAIALAT